ncbi:MAG: 6-pyruvoyl-tetrahydropterin synthase-related protein [bacterium]|nr:6-pyruvoyl-tetrahydropterin synthase-related protein [bacterium]
MKKIAKYTFNIFSITTNTLLQASICVIATALLAFLAFIIDPTFAQNNTGTDMLSAYGYVQWMNRFFPQIPFWYPLQGAGVSFMAGYQWLAFMIVLAIHNITKIPIFPIFNTLRFISFPITAIGIFLFCWTRLQYPRQAYIRQIIGIIAGIFYLIVPTTWYWSYKWGFYAESVSIMFIPPALICIDWFIDLSFKKDNSIKKRIALAGGLLFYILAFLAHFGAGFSLTHIIPLMIISRGLYEIRRQRVEALKNTIVVGLIFFSLFAATFAWRLIPYLDYTHQSKVGGYAGDLFVKEVSTEPNRPTLKQLAQLEYLYQPDYRFIFNEFSIPLAIWILAAFGVIFGPLRTQKLFYLGICSTFGFFAYTYFQDLSFVYLRSLWTLFRITIPIIAAYGAFMMGDSLLFILDVIFKRTIHGIHFTWIHLVRPLPAIALTLFFTVAVIYQIEVKNDAILFKLPKRDTMVIINKPGDAPIFRIANNRRTDLRDIWDQPKPIPDQSEKNEARRATFNSYNPGQLEKTCNANTKDDQNLNSICDEFIQKSGIISKNTIARTLKTCEMMSRKEMAAANHWCLNFYMPLEYQLTRSNWPDIKFIEPKASLLSAESNTFFSHIPQKPLETRFDLSAKTGSMIMQSPLLTDVSQTQVYVHELNLFAALWNYQSSVMYADQPINQKPGVISEIAKYFGYEYILAITNTETALNQYKNDPNWENIILNEGSIDKENKDWWRFKNPTSITSWTNKPAILFITDQKHYLYDQAFKIANLGVIPYDKAIVFSGTEFLDDYSLDELQKFNMLYLEGYKYHNEAKARNILDKYVKSGGRLFIDTGWQFNNPDWQLKDATAFFPSNAYQWKEVGTSARMLVDDTAFMNYSPPNKDIGLLTLPPSALWGVSTPTDIRSGSHVILQTNNNPLLVAKEYEKGRVVWSGMNSIMHIEGGKNENKEEIDLLAHTIDWALQGSTSNTQDLKVNVSRGNPDEVNFTFEESTDKETTLYFRESYYPLWAASLKSSAKGNKTLEVFTAGPRFMGIRIPPVQKGNVATLYIKTSLKYSSFNALALTTAIFLLLYVIGIIKPHKFIPTFISTRQKAKELRKDLTMKVHEDPNEETPDEPEKTI